ncbi:cupin domain-containing protein [Microbispora bryophytorum]|uniref:Cupin domain-containing protein n=1 Tax=Microbispora bryophytorum subsp. camponoti TaxID=1677852 RepID=A0ABR8L3K7_9ACTN|nr:cupin domain-containing protein [Microbispora camponoti]MBD3145535.1 cupin domain-containing protein [Microbispora camponoti]
MISKRIAGGVLIAGTAAAILGCAPGTEQPAAQAIRASQAQATTVTQATHTTQEQARAAAQAGAAMASGHPSESLKLLIQKALPNVPGKTFTSAIVTLPPDARAMPHRHGDAFVYAYVLKGTVRSRLGGEPMRTYHQGENWTEQPGAHHVATENASKKEPAELLVVFVSTTGDPLKVDDPHK